MDKKIVEFYTRKKEEFILEEKRLSIQVKEIAWFRFIAFCLVLFSLIYLTKLTILVGVISALIFLVLFFYLVKLHIIKAREEKRFGILVGIAKDELKALSFDFSSFENGVEFLNPEHIFSYDLDLFGDGSMFQYLNRTSTQSGKKRLSRWLIEPSLSKDDILKIQASVKEIASMREWRLQFLASGKMFEETEQLHNEIIFWSKKDMPLSYYKLLKYLKWIIPVVTLIALIPVLFNGPYQIFVALLIVQWLAAYFYKNRIKEYFRFFGQKSQLLEKYMSLLKEIESQRFSSEWLNEKLHAVTNPQSACKTITNLGKLVREFEYRQNILVAFILNSIFLWDVRCIYNLRKWHVENKDKLVEWLEVIENIDALISLANYADNHPGYTYPNVKESDFELSAINLGHPLLHPEKRICSDFQINKSPQIIIVTGANMAGKSTFLRSVGVNLILARMGVPVCAQSFEFTPIGIFTNMRTTDSLFKDESYFYAELKRLSYVLERLRSGEKLFVILDEMLKGTNSVDKLKGSQELVRQMIGLKTVALIATHDLKLSEMDVDFPGVVVNKCFEIHIQNDELTFDYRLTEGVTKTMNATFLMKKMGII